MAQPEGAGAPPRAEEKKEKRKARSSSPGAEDIGRVTVLDVLRVLGGLVLLNFALSWYVTGESLTWGWRPWFARADGLKAWMVSCFLFSPLQLGLSGKEPGMCFLSLFISIFTAHIFFWRGTRFAQTVF